MQRPVPWNSAVDGDLQAFTKQQEEQQQTSADGEQETSTTTKSLEKLTPEQAREKYINFVKNKSRSSNGSKRSILGLYLGPLPEANATNNAQNSKFSPTSSAITNSSIQTLKGYKIDNPAPSANSPSNTRTATLQIDTQVWNKVWEMFFNDEESQDAAYDLVKREGKVTSSRAVLLRLFGSSQQQNNNQYQNNNRYHNNNRGNQYNQQQQQQNVVPNFSPAALSNLKKDVEMQARSCGPVEFVRVFEGKEVLVQFTTESAARVFQGTCAITAGNNAGGFLSKIQNEFGIPDPRAVITNAQRMDLFLSFGKKQQQQQQQQQQNEDNNKKTNSRVKVAPALDLKVAVAEDSADGTTSTIRTSSGEVTYSYGIQLNASYVKALFEAAGAVEVKAIPASVVSSTTAASATTTTQVTFKRFYIKFESFLDAQVALHSLQFPLRRVFGLSLNYTADEPEPELPEALTRKPGDKIDDGKVAVKGGTNTKFDSDDE